MNLTPVTLTGKEETDQQKFAQLDPLLAWSCVDVAAL